MHIFTICTSRYGRFSSQSLLRLDGFSSLAFIRYVVRGGTFENDNWTCRQYSFSFQWLDAVVLLLPTLSMMLFSLLFSCSPFSYTFSSTFCVKRSFFFLLWHMWVCVLCVLLSMGMPKPLSTLSSSFGGIQLNNFYFHLHSTSIAHIHTCCICHTEAVKQWSNWMICAMYYECESDRKSSRMRRNIDKVGKRGKWVKAGKGGKRRVTEENWLTSKRYACCRLYILLSLYPIFPITKMNANDNYY